MTKLPWPCWFTSPDGSGTEIFDHESDVPRGWTTGAERVSIEAVMAPANSPIHEPPPAPALEKRGRKPKAEPLDL